jgi:hypothetical protein
LHWAIGELAAVFVPPIDPALATLGTGPLRPAAPLGRLRGERPVHNLAELDPGAGLPEFKLRSARVAWW